MEHIDRPTTLYRDTAATLFAELSTAVNADNDDSPEVANDRRYATLRRVLTEAAEQQTADVPLVFVGLLARIDYLVRSRGMDAGLAVSIGRTRHALFSPRSNLRRLSTAQQAQAWPHHLEAVCRFVSALFSCAEVPAELVALFPLQKTCHQWSRADMHRLRVVVSEWNDDIIVARMADSSLEVSICYGPANEFLTQNGEQDWSYLGTLLRVGQQLNIINVRTRDNRLLPELIVVEPDCLIDVSTITSCMETYTEDAVVNMLNRLKPQQNSSATLLGNLAGQFLDETIHGEQLSYADSLTTFFSHNALGIATCDELSDREQSQQFHAAARRQQQLIGRLMGHDLPSAVAEFSRQQSLLEPSFFCETLGLQGRMDLLQPGLNLIVEQKSGKGQWVPMGAAGYSQEVPVQREPHYAQLLLYRAMLQYGLGLPARGLTNLFLLYSRYQRGLLRLGASPTLLHRAMRLRNALACQERRLTEDGWEQLLHLSPEALNTKGTSGPLWQQYIRPQLTQLLSPIQTATRLEQLYALRMLRFVTTEQLLARVGTGSQHPGAAGKWLLSLEEKRAAGDILCDMTINHLHQQGRNVTEVELKTMDSTVAALNDKADTTATTNFRRGDVVVMYSYAAGSQPDVCAQMVMRGTIACIDSRMLAIRLRNAQTDPQVFSVPDDYRWAVEHDLYESTQGSLYRGIQAMLTAPESRRQLLLVQRRPHIDTSIGLQGDYGTFNELVLRAKQSREAFLVIGPPGTGKTSFALMNILREELLEADNSVLLLAFTNRAVDEICSKLDEAAIDYLRLGSDLAAAETCRPHLLEQRVGNLGSVAQVRKMLCNIRVVCSTTASMCGSGLDLLRLRRFSLAIIDEASQLLEPHLLPLLSQSAIGRFVLIGDHKQLPAVVQQTVAQSRVSEAELRAIGLTDCRRSLFERWLTEWQHDARHVYMLKRQGRMHQDIAHFPSQYFYDGLLDVATARQKMPSRQPRLQFINVQPPASSPSDRVNMAEAKVAAHVVVQTWLHYGTDFNADSTVGVIVPYRSQISVVRQAIATAVAALPVEQATSVSRLVLSNITIDTVERFQGSQRDTIVYCFTIQQRHQLSFLTSSVFEEDGQVIDRKLNVAMTRARERLVMTGHAALLQENLTFARLIEYIKEHGFYTDA